MAAIDSVPREAQRQSGGGPTVVVGLGSFGGVVLDRLRDAGVGAPLSARRRPVLLALEATGRHGDHVTQIVECAEGLLGLDAAFEAEPGDDRRPQLDVFLVADLGDAAVAHALPELVTATGERLLTRFSNIFPGHDLPNLTICPVVALLGVRGGDGAAAARGALSALESRAGSVKFRAGDASPVARVFVVEQQSARYELKPREVESTVVAFLSLVIGTDLRQREPMRSFLRSSVGQLRDKCMFASFGCATLELNLNAYCVARAAGEVVDGIRAASAAGAGQHAVAAQSLVPDAAQIAEGLCRPAEGDDLVELLRAHTPRIDFPSIGERDTPEQIRNVAYGWGWFDALDNAVKAQVKRLDEREMDEVTRVADERGLKRLRGIQRQLRRDLRRAERAGPHGWADALRLAEHVRDRCDRELAALQSKVKEQVLPAFPEPTQVESALSALREETNLRPRPYRMAFFGALATLVGAGLLHHLPKWFVVCILTGSLSPFSLSPSSMSARVGGPWRFVLDPPYVVLWLVAIFGVLIYLALDRYRKRRHQELLARREELQAAVRRYLEDDVGASVRRYYETRLWLSLHAWALRTLHRVRAIAAHEAKRLANVSAGLDRLSRELGAQTRRAERAAEGEGGDLVYRTHMSAEMLRQAYEVARPPGDLSGQLFAEADADAGDIPSFLREAELRALVAPHCVPSHEQLGALAGPMVVAFVEQRHGKLGVPLEVRSHDERTAEQRYLFAPAWAEDALKALRERLPTLPDAHTHADPDRVHLVSLQTALTRDSIALPDVAGDGS